VTATSDRNPGVSADLEVQLSGSNLNRRQFLTGSLGAAAGAGLLAACGSPSSPSGAASASRPPISKEPGGLSILEWNAYEAAGTKAQVSGMTLARKS
jgi:hypothetical protein